MIVEAATEASGLRDVNTSPISKFYLKDVHLTAALQMPESSGVEIPFIAHPAKPKPKTRHQNLYHLTLTLVVNITGSDFSTKHCDGHASDSNSIPGMLSFHVYGVRAQAHQWTQLQVRDDKWHTTPFQTSSRYLSSIIPPDRSGAVTILRSKSSLL